MLQLSDLSELLGDYVSGDVSWMIAYSVLLELLGGHEVAEAMSGLTPELAMRFDGALHESFQRPSSGGPVMRLRRAETRRVPVSPLV